MRAVNLLPRDEPRRRKWMTVRAQLALASPLVVASLLGAGYLVTTSKVSDNRATLQALQEELATLPPPAGVPQVDSQLAQQHDARVSALALALRNRVAWDRILRQISSVLPEDVWLIDLAAQSPGGSAPPPGPAPAATEGGALAEAVPAPAVSAGSTPLVVNGYTYSQEGVARFLSRLAVIPELTDVKLKQSELTTVSGRVVVRFTIEAGIREQVAS